MTIRAYWEKIEGLVQEYEKKAQSDPKLLPDPGFEQARNILKKLIEQGKDIEDYSVFSFSGIRTLMRKGDALKDLGKKVGSESVPDISGPLSFAFAIDYLALLEKFEEYTKVIPNWAIRENIGPEKAKVKVLAGILDKKIKVYKASNQSGQDKMPAIDVNSSEGAKLNETELQDQIKKLDSFIAKLNEINVDNFIAKLSDPANELSGYIIDSLKSEFEKLMTLKTLKERYDAFIKHNATLDLTDALNGDLKDFEEIYVDFKKLLSDEQLQKWNDNEALLGWSYKGTVNWIKGWTGYGSSTKPTPKGEMFSLLLDEINSSISSKIKQEFKQQSDLLTSHIERSTSKKAELQQQLVQNQTDNQPKVLKPDNESKPQSESKPEANASSRKSFTKEIFAALTSSLDALNTFLKPLSEINLAEIFDRFSKSIPSVSMFTNYGGFFHKFNKTSAPVNADGEPAITLVGSPKK